MASSLRGSAPDVDWAAKAACVGKPAGLFFPETPRGNGRHGPEAWAAGKAVCAACPVQPECLAHALADGVVYGLWGGLSPSEREQHTLNKEATR